VNYLEYGQVIYFDAGEDISANTNTLVLEPQAGTKKEVTATLGTVATVVNGVTYPANEHVSYTVAANDLDYQGFWRIKLKSQFSNDKILQTDYKRFLVKA